MSKFPYWLEPKEANLRAVGPNMYVGAELAPAHSTHMGWELIVDLYGTMTVPSRAAAYNTAKQRVSLPFNDGLSFPAGVLDSILPLVLAARQRGPVLFHCQAGVSRSASVAYAMLRVIDGMSHDEALARVKILPGYPRSDTLASARKWVHRVKGRTRR